MLRLRSKKRTETGKGLGRLRQSGFVPAVLYGSAIQATPVAVSQKEFLRAWNEAGESGLIELALDDGAETHTVLIRELQRDPMSGLPIHADFFQVRMDEQLEVTIALDFTGASPAVSEGVGTLVKDLHEVQIRALPNDLPGEIIVDLAILRAVDDAIHVKDLAVPAAVEVLADPDLTVAHVAPLFKEEELKPAEEERSVEDIEVVGKAKKEEEEAAEEAESKE